MDAIGLEPVDEVSITTLVDNRYDALLTDAGPVRRAPRTRFPRVPSPQFEHGETTPGLVAEHGFAALVTTRAGDRTHTVLFDALYGPDLISSNGAGTSTTTIPSAVIVALFAYLATRVVARYGFGRQRQDD